MNALRITEIFYSLQGETRFVGLPTVFIRLTGCPLRCQYCDTAYAFSGGKLLSIIDIMQQVAAFSPQYVTVTGGEPLAQPLCFNLLTQLCDAGYRVSLETSGALSIEHIDVRVTTILDVKTPGSKESHRNEINNFCYLKPEDEIKFVICDRADYDWSKDFLHQHQLIKRCNILFSPSHQQLPQRTLADWIIEDRLPVRFQLQLHKYVWGDVRGK